MTKTFIDSNIIVYANDRRDKNKQLQAIACVSSLISSGDGVVSTQVLQEYAATALAKLHQKPEVVLRQISLLEKCEVVRQSPAMIRRAVEIHHTYKISFWDASIIANAESAACDSILSEDLNTGQFYAGIRIKNPFLEP